MNQTSTSLEPRNVKTLPLLRRLYVQIVLFGAFAMAFAILMFTWKTGNDQSDFAFNAIESQAKTLAYNTASAAGNYIVVKNFGALEELLLEASSYDDVLALKVFDAQGFMYGDVRRRPDGTVEPVYDTRIHEVPLESKAQTSIENNILSVYIPIEQGNLGWVELKYSLESVEVVQREIWRNGIFTAILVFLLSVLLLVLFLRSPMRSISKATEFARGLYKTTGQVMPFQPAAYEIEQLEHALNFAAHRIYNSNKELNDLKSALDAHAVVGICNKAGKLTYVNDRFVEISGYGRHELLGNGYNMLNSGYHTDSFYESMWRDISQGKVWNGEVRDRSKAGEIYWVDTTIVPFLNEGREPYQYICIQTDITERKRAEEMNARLGRILDDSVNEIFICDIESYKVLQVNKGAKENLGYSEASLHEMTLLDINAEYTNESFGLLVNTLMQNAWRQLNFESKHQRKDGSIYPVEIHLQISQAEVPYVLVAIVQDISEKKETANKLREYQEHLEEMVEERTNNLKVVNRELESFSYSVSHDLRGPLRSIDGFSQALLEDYAEQLDDTAKNYLDRVRASSQRMGELIDDLLHLSRVVRTDMVRKNIDMSDLAERVISQLREREPDREIEFTNTFGLCAKGDERLILTMLENLLGNAWKFTARTEHPQIEFGMCKQEQGMAFFIRDNGAGFDESYKHKLFEPFQRLHSSEEYEGTGIGLATVLRIVRRHAGNVWASSAEGAGATIYFTLGDEL